MASREMQKRLRELAAALKAEPGSIPRRLELAAALREASRSADAIDLYRGVAEVYAEEGRLVQAMAVCKGILEIDREHRDTLEMLANLAQRRAGRKNPAELKQVDGRWIAEPSASSFASGGMPLDQVTPVSIAGFSPFNREGVTRAGDEPDATRVGDEEVSDVRQAMWSKTPPRGMPPLEIEVISEAARVDTDPGSRRPSGDDLASSGDGVTDPHMPALDFPAETKARARGGTLRELDTQRGMETIPEEASASQETRAAVRSAIDRGREASSGPGELEEAPPHLTPPALDWPDEDSGNLLIHDVLTAPFPRPALQVEPPPFPLLSDLPRGAFMELLSRLTVLHLEAGHVVLKEGELGDACYLIAAGAVRVSKAGVGTAAPVELAILGPGSFFGEFAVLADQRRHASVETIEPVELLEIRRGLLDELVAAHPGVARTLRKFYRERLLSTLMATAPFFQRLQPEERVSIAERFRPRRFGRGARVIEEGSPGGGLFLILVGEVQVVRGGGEPTAAEPEVVLGTLGEGSYFGEMSLLRGGVASATVKATRMTEVVQLPPRDFYEVVSQHPVLWEQLRSEAERREMANHAIVSGEARKSDDGTIYLV